MSTNTSAERTAALVDAYYESWKRGIASFDEDRVRGLLAPDLAFDGPIAGRRTGAEPFLQGLARFVATITAFHPLQQIHTETEAAAIYDCDLPGGRVRFAEFFRIAGDRIQAITLLFDADRFQRLSGG
jgi:hypothetical protein